jgi:Tol biopolymer transport system component
VKRFGVFLTAAAISVGGLALLVSAFGAQGRGGAPAEGAPAAIGKVRGVYWLYHPGKDRNELWVVGERAAAPLGIDGILPELSPDGRTIAFAGDVEDPGNVDIYTVGVDGTGLRRLTKDPHVDTSPDWSADGREIVFEREDGQGHAELFVTQADGSGERQLTTNQVTNDSGPDWSPDGRTILFTRYVGTNAEIMAVDPAGGEPKRVTSSPGTDGGARWAPDGSLVAFARDPEEDDRWEAWVMRPDGSGEAFVAGLGFGFRWFLEWSSDGSALILGRGEGGWPEGFETEVVTANISGGGPVPFPVPEGLASALASGWRILGLEVA